MTSNLVDAVVADFLTKNDSVDSAAVSSFCQFFKDWLAQKKIIGIGQTTDGFSVRFADNSEKILYSADSTTADSFAVAISGSAGKSDRTAVDNSSFRITGN
jgi:hypothetical protein